ncbi:TRASH domain-containing protein, partial [Candidatus Sumerlaeota bacterium]|nr:TRASH domain-containing protein [Candidatus Sumerlaeota bacterium]
MNFHRITHSMLAIALGCGLLIPAALLGAGEKKDAKAEKKEEAKGETSYPIDICVMSGEKLGSMGDPVIYKHEGREIRFCCPNCLDTFKANPAEGLKKLDEAIIKEQIKAYPLDTCVVSGDKMDHGEPVNVVVQNRLVRICCDSCK